MRHDVERGLEAALSGDAPAIDFKTTTGLVLLGLVPLVLVVAALVAIVLLVKLVV